MSTEAENRKFYSYPTGYASDGGYSFLCGLERKVPDGIERNGIRAWLVGYDEAKRLWPTEKDREWFNP
jgi:hypothetical protein